MSSSEATPVSKTGAAIQVDFAIRLRGISKRFKIYKNMVLGPIKEALFPWRREKLYREFVAVDSLDLTIPKGQVIGILGRNGSGKTTTLKMIAGLLNPTTGTVEVRGRVTALLAVGVGVNPEFSGRENVYYTGMLLGMTKAEVLRKMDGIVAFSEIGEFIDRPFRTYSTGMKARLLFSISMSLNPEILIIDEALAAGDAHFVAKCNAKMKELCRSGATVLLVSHNLLQIQELADRVVILDHGRLVADGAPAEVISKYHDLLFSNNARAAAARANPNLPFLSGSGEVVISRAALADEVGAPISSVYSGDPMTLQLDLQATWDDLRTIKLFVGIDRMPTMDWISEIHSDRIVDPQTGQVAPKLISVGRDSRISVRIRNSLLLNGHYSFWVIVMDANLNVLCEYRGVAPFFASRRAYVHLVDAIFAHPCEIDVQQPAHLPGATT